MCKVFGISRQAYYEAKRPTGQLPLPLKGPRAPAARGVSAAELLAAIEAIVAQNPAWGVRKVWAMLRRPPYDMRVSQRRVYALMKANGLTLKGEARPEPEPRRGTVVVEEPNRLWATDLTTVFTEQDGLVAVVPVMDCGCRTLLALSVTKAQHSTAVLSPVQEALVVHFGEPSEVPYGFELRTDHGPQYTGADCEALCEQWRIVHTFAPVGRPTGNAAAERLIRTMKEECIWLRDWKSAAELRAALEAWMARYNESRPHQALSWQTPAERRAERLAHLPAIQVAA